MKHYSVVDVEDYDSGERYKVVTKSFSTYIKEDFIEATKRLLRGEYGFMCQYDEDPDFETVWSSVFDLKKLMIYRAEGDPRKKKFITDNRLHHLIRRTIFLSKVRIKRLHAQLLNSAIYSIVINPCICSSITCLIASASGKSGIVILSRRNHIFFVIAR